jgi:hypothetical protein
MDKRYSELVQFATYEERLKYLALNGRVGRSTFGFDRYLNQHLYRSDEWKAVRVEVIVRDSGNDLGLKGHEIYVNLLVHHMNPLTPDQIRIGDENMFNPEYLITVSDDTHRAIHYGIDYVLRKRPIVRSPGDTKLW